METQVKTDEEYPLLRVEAGGGDGKVQNSTPPTVMTTGWNITCTPKQSWCNRWPEFVSAFWMTLILLAISFLVFYALGMSAYRRQPVVFVKCNNSHNTRGSNVFYHHILARNSYVPFTLFSDYLSFMATNYPSLRFYIYFLIDDSWQTRYSNPRLLKRLVPHISGPLSTILYQNNKRDIRDFERRYQNVNISVVYLSKYMAMTPLRYKWKTIPLNYLSFYARIYEIWQNGGIGLDLVTFNNRFINNKELDHRIDAILKEHNNGIETEKYENVLNFIDNDEPNELFSMFFNLVNHVLNETRSFFNTDYTTNLTVNYENHPFMKFQRSKRDVAVDIANITNTNSTLKVNENNKYQFYDTNHNVSLKKENISSEMINNSDSSISNLIKDTDIRSPNDSVQQNVTPHVWFFYDIFGFPDDTVPTYFLPKLVQSGEATVTASKRSNYISLTPEGQFVAASSRHHPFLAQLFSSGCHRLDPRYAIKDTLFNQCSGFLRDDVYCENIRIIYDVV